MRRFFQFLFCSGRRREGAWSTKRVLGEVASCGPGASYPGAPGHVFRSGVRAGSSPANCSRIGSGGEPVAGAARRVTNAAFCLPERACHRGSRANLDSSLGPEWSRNGAIGAGRREASGECEAWLVFGVCLGGTLACLLAVELCLEWWL